MSDREDDRATGRQDSPARHDTPDLVDDGGSHQDVDDLFGDDSDQDVQKPQRRLDDEELDSGDDLERNDRLEDTVEGQEEEEQGRALRLMHCDVPRLNYPAGDEFYLLNLPAFLGVHQTAFSEDTYEPQNLAHDGDKTRETSMYSTAMSSIFWRRDPDNSNGALQSNARFVRWEDGSITLQLASKPTEQYNVATTSMRQNFKKKLPPGTAYDPAKDSHTFLAALQQTDVIDVQLIHALDASMKIQPAGGATDESQNRLKQALASARDDHDPLARPKEVREDPEAARKAAEQFEKDRVRAQRKRENAEERQTLKRQGVLGRVGLGGSRGMGLTAADLEDDMGMPTSRGRRKMPKRRTNQHGEIYSDGEDIEQPRTRTREDAYEMDDGFLVDSDVEPEEYDDDELLDDDEEDDEGDQSPPRQDRDRRERTPKRSRSNEPDEDDDAEGEPDDEALQGNSATAARKKRRVIADDDDEEE